MFSMKPFRIAYSFRNFLLKRPLSTHKWCVENLNKRTVLKLSGPDTNNYLQSIITNNIQKIENSPVLFSLLLNPNGRVLYDVLLYKMTSNEYLLEYESSTFEYLERHLVMYRLRKNVKIEPLKIFSVWVIYPESEQDNSSYSSSLEVLVDSFAKREGIVTSVIDPRTNLLGVRVITTKDVNLPSLMPENNFKCSEADSYRIYRYKLGVGEGVLDHPPGRCLPFDTNVDFMNGVSFDKGCYIGQELTARLHFTGDVRKRLMPIVLEPKDSYPEFPPECDILNDKNMKMGRLRSNLDQYGLALLKYEDSLKSRCLLLKGFDIKLKPIKPKWWPTSI